MNLFQLEAWRMYRHNQAALHPLTYIMWECTLRCNLSCGHCGSDCTKSSSTPDMKLEDFIKVLDGIAKVQDPAGVMIGLTGGEPLLRNDLAAAGKEFNRRGFRWGMVSNGLLMDRKRLDGLLASGLGSLSISIDGLEAEHNNLRGNPTSFSRALTAARMAAQEKNLAFDVISCIHDGNFDSLGRLRDLLVETGVKNWRLFTIFPEGRASMEKAPVLSEGKFKQLLEFIKETRELGLIAAQYACEGYLGSFEKKVRNNPFFCGAGINFASVLCDGSISGCPSIRSPAFVQGSIYQDNFMDVWENRFTAMRNRSWAKKGICQKCKSWRYCEGNGLHLHTDMQSGPSRCNLQWIN